MATQKFKEGDTVQWTSQASGFELTKRGTVIAVCRTEGIELTQKTMVKILREINPDLTVKEAKARAKHRSHFHMLKDKYRLRFDHGWRDNTHYLVEVDQGEGRKPHLYHPRTEMLEAV
jgi:hypothetical protein